MTDTELKALAYDQLALIERSQANIRLINQELSERATPKDVKDEKN